METLTGPSPVTFTRFPAIHVRCHRGGLRHFLGLLLSSCRVGSCGEDGTGGSAARAMLTVDFGIRVSLAAALRSELAGSHDFDNSRCRGRLLGDSTLLAGGCLNSGIY